MQDITPKLLYPPPKITVERECEHCVNDTMTITGSQFIEPLRIEIDDDGSFRVVIPWD